VTAACVRALQVMYAFLNVVGLVKAWRKDERLTESKVSLLVTQNHL